MAAVDRISKGVAVQRLVESVVGNGEHRLLLPSGPLRDVVPDRIKRTGPIPPFTPL
ncbi:hypothetical protein [Streptomyces tailanensis]|uniref:hypothetical protein n=1 Tax=Streptomyces tailanensis TaxID=2569858 RepID=UPI00155A566F|nr:hypothetical protein [Streptomyces tailanensis]